MSHGMLQSCPFLLRGRFCHFISRLIISALLSLRRRTSIRPILCLTCSWRGRVYSRPSPYSKLEIPDAVVIMTILTKFRSNSFLSQGCFWHIIFLLIWMIFCLESNHRNIIFSRSLPSRLSLDDIFNCSSAPI